MVQGESGGKTSLIGGFSSVILAIVILALAPLLEYLPMACLAGIIIVNLKGLLFKVTDLAYYYRISMMEAILWLITFLTVVLSDVDIGVYIGIAASFLMNTIRTQRPRFAILGRVGDTTFYKNIKVFPSAEQHLSIKVLRFDGSLYACNAPFFKRKFYELIDFQRYEKTQHSSISKRMSLRCSLHVGLDGFLWEYGWSYNLCFDTRCSYGHSDRNTK
ncbi:unnamed protein product [Rotaria sp. Silwood2]|nr:unnamed protein product [Rotaria sp. Silwood2]